MNRTLLIGSLVLFSAVTAMAKVTDDAPVYDGDPAYMIVFGSDLAEQLVADYASNDRELYEDSQANAEILRYFEAMGPDSLHYFSVEISSEIEPVWAISEVNSFESMYLVLNGDLVEYLKLGKKIREVLMYSLEECLYASVSTNDYLR